MAFLRKFVDKKAEVGGAGWDFSATGRIAHLGLILGGLFLNHYSRGTSYTTAASTPRVFNAAILT
jgi:hypothetical protein